MVKGDQWAYNLNKYFLNIDVMAKEGKQFGIRC